MNNRTTESVQNLSHLILATTKRGSIDGSTLSGLLVALDEKVDTVGRELLECEPLTGERVTALAATISLGRRASRAGRKFLITKGIN